MISCPLDIRPATRTDCAPLAKLMRAQFREHHIRLSGDAIAHVIDGALQRPAWARLLVATSGGKPVGFAALSFMWTYEHGGRSAWLDELYVKPAHRGRGIGRELLHAAYRVAAKAGAAALDLEVDAGHRDAERLYAREGFHALGRRRWSRRLQRGPAVRASRRPR
jgi:GNAT superfamily N-acetyltransferase